MNDQFQKLAQENQKQGKKEDKSLEGKLAKSEQAMGKLKKEIDRKNEKLAEKDKEIFALEVKIVGLEREIDQNEQKMAKKAEEICALKEEIGQKDQKLAEQEAKIVALENEIAKLKQKKTVDQQSTIGKVDIDDVKTWAEVNQYKILHQNFY
jgi:chromosome segregation ATPase